ncbi:hypothetical protein BDN71DRAFT_1451490 [Pleurotus eryngii]|uniref:Uncharacterized protein n=1 Tax=Pleurotus eryngii TaxID=5323 RepID=A0A9P5ZRT9_PLEER|nr:hypothetical protein BDN71DRAFT_1451490 [Pleurotus eryngii]
MEMQRRRAGGHEEPGIPAYFPSYFRQRPYMRVRIPSYWLRTLGDWDDDYRSSEWTLGSTVFNG